MEATFDWHFNPIDATTQPSMRDESIMRPALVDSDNDNVLDADWAIYPRWKEPGRLHHWCPIPQQEVIRLRWTKQHIRWLPGIIYMLGQD